MTVPASMNPKPKAPSALSATPSLSNPAARPTGFANVDEKVPSVGHTFRDVFRGQILNPLTLLRHSMPPTLQRANSAVNTRQATSASPFASSSARRSSSATTQRRPCYKSRMCFTNGSHNSASAFSRRYAATTNLTRCSRTSIVFQGIFLPRPLPGRAECKQCLGTPCKECHGTEQKNARNGAPQVFVAPEKRAIRPRVWKSPHSQRMNANV